jgi:hypothetical protein
MGSLGPLQVQPGWNVYTADGDELGTVKEVSESLVRVRKRGLLGGTISVGPDDIASVEPDHVSLARTREELDAGARWMDLSRRD